MVKPVKKMIGIDMATTGFLKIARGMIGSSLLFSIIGRSMIATADNANIPITGNEAQGYSVPPQDRASSKGTMAITNAVTPA